MRRPRAVVFIEFAMIFPLFLFLSLLAVDTGRWVLVRAELQDATQQAARAGAQTGGASVVVRGGPASQYTFNQALDNYGFGQETREFKVVAGSFCSEVDRYVTVSGSFQAPKPITLGLMSFLEIVYSGPPTLTATSVALCEITAPG